MQPNVSTIPLGDFKRVGAFRGIRRHIRECGGNPNELFRDFGIEAQLFDHADNYVYYPSIIRLLEHCAVTFDRPHFGFEIGARHNVESLGPMCLVMLASSSVREALSYASRYICVHSPGGRVDLHVDDGQASLDYRVTNTAMTAFRQISEFSMATAFRVVEGLAGKGFAMTEVHIGSDAPAARTQQLERFFCAPVIYRDLSIRPVLQHDITDLRLDFQ